MLIFNIVGKFKYRRGSCHKVRSAKGYLWLFVFVLHISMCVLMNILLCLESFYTGDPVPPNRSKSQGSQNSL